MRRKRKLTGLVLGLAAAAVLADPLPAAEPVGGKARPKGFPEHAMTMIVPYGPGGGSGQLARAMSEAIKEATGITVTPEYKPGGAGMDGLRAYMDVAPDGYTVLEHIDDAVSAYAIGKSTINPAEDLIPLIIAQITFSQIYIRSNESRFHDWASFVEFVKAQNGRTTLANVAGAGSMERINMNRIAKHYGMHIQQISFDQGSARYAALKDGQVDALFEQPGDVRKYLKSGEFKPILTLLKERPAAFAHVPSMSDVGLDFKPLMRFRGFFVRKETPPDRVAWLERAFKTAYHEPGFAAFNKRRYMDLIPSFRDSAGALALIKETLEIYRKTYKEMGLIE